MKKRPILVLFHRRKNIVVAGITSNLSREGVLIKKKDGVDKDSIIRLDYIFTIEDSLIERKLTTISEEIKKEVCKNLKECICGNFIEEN
ncbi:MAG: type II toxin-antitoxin system PemK/MazF family toxin [Candidatus Heimdallarchaeaceae archaeon]